MNLHQKLNTTEPGSIANAISEAIYCDGSEFKKFKLHGFPDGLDDMHKVLCRARDYLEKEALARLAEDPEAVWVRELDKRLRAAEEKRP